MQNASFETSIFVSTGLLQKAVCMYHWILFSVSFYHAIYPFKFYFISFFLLHCGFESSSTHIMLIPIFLLHLLPFCISKEYQIHILFHRIDSISDATVWRVHSVSWLFIIKSKWERKNTFGKTIKLFRHGFMSSQQTMTQVNLINDRFRRSHAESPCLQHCHKYCFGFYMLYQNILALINPVFIRQPLTERRVLASVKS